MGEEASYETYGNRFLYHRAVSGWRVVVAGAGANVFTFHRPGLDAIGARVVGVQDVDQAAAARVADELGCPEAASLAELLAIPADLAVVLAPHPFHEEITVAALRAGLHILTEKPIAVSVSAAERMVAEAERCKRVLAVAFQHRTRSEVREAHRLVGEGFLGELQRADVLGSWPRRRSYFELAPWRGTWRGEGGGILINQGQHELDLLCYLAGPPARVIGWTRTRLHAIETEDSAQAMVEWPNGALGSIHITTAEVDLPQRIELTGTAGRMRILKGSLELVTNAVDFRTFASAPGGAFDPVPEGRREERPGGGGGHVDLYRDLDEALTTGRSPLAPGSDAVRTLELANAIIFSSLTHAQVELPLDRPAFDALLDRMRGSQPA
jgi:predicted dehydrogenase